MRQQSVDHLNGAGTNVHEALRCATLFVSNDTPATFCSGFSGRIWRKIWCNFGTSVFALLSNLLVDLRLIA